MLESIGSRLRYAWVILIGVVILAIALAYGPRRATGQQVPDITSAVVILTDEYNKTTTGGHLSDASTGMPLVQEGLTCYFDYGAGDPGVSQTAKFECNHPEWLAVS